MQELLIVAGAHLLGAASPGPDLALVLKNSLSGGRKIGTYTALGIALGITIHVFYSIVGLGVLISKSILLFNTIKLIGASYLIWIGLKALRSKKSNSLSDSIDNTEILSSMAAFKQGFLTNVMNPKVTLFFLSLFTQVISSDTSNVIKLLYGVEMTIMTFVWFAFVAFCMTRRPIQAGYSKVKHHIDHAFGAVLIALGLKVATSQK